ncbi:MAG: DUF2188 domain-containing protein [Streptosporangiales bacterium]
MERRQVTPRQDGHWQIRNPARDQVSVVVPTEEDAVQRAIRVLRSAGGGELNVHRADGDVSFSQRIIADAVREAA